ncbi:MAG TPA: hypothetical protein PKE55_02880 [Kiritimatiellia bacterium]|nr:hypothetical protein [Kiritimatiellia bacterium]
MTTFPPFDLKRLLTTVFSPQPGERIGILIDLPNPSAVADFRYLFDEELSIQRIAHDVFYQGLKGGVASDLNLIVGGFYAYAVTGGSNLDLPDEGWSATGEKVSLAKDVYANHDILLCISTYSATAPLTASAKQIGFRGATLHGVNDIILASGLSVDYHEVSREAEALRQVLTRADAFEIDFVFSGTTYTLRLETRGQEAQKSHGLCPPGKPDIANLPAGEVYYVPESAAGSFPMQFEDGTIGRLEVVEGHVTTATLLRGDEATITAFNEKLASDPACGVIGELGFGTQRLPVSGRDIQDEKILGTLHVATGRSDHLGGDVDSSSFNEAGHATHDDILFAPFKTPDIHVPVARMFKEGKVVPVIEHYAPAAVLVAALESV